MAIEVNGEKIEVIDSHIHAAYEFKKMVQNFDAAGIDRGVIFPRGAFGSDYAESNASIAKGMEAFPNRIIGFGRISSRLGKERSERTFDECMKMGLKGIKLHPILDVFDADDRKLLGPIMEKAGHYKVPVLFHCGRAAAASPVLIADLAQDYPDVSVIVAHMGYRDRADETIALAKRVKNLYLDTAIMCHIRLLARAVETVGPERVLHGSDHPAQPFRFELEKIAIHLREFAGLDNKSLALILGKNLKRLVGM